MYFAGFDIGSGFSKVVVIDAEDRVVFQIQQKTHTKFQELANELLDQVVTQGGIPRQEVAYVMGTGLGRYSIPFRGMQVTELTAAACGAKRLYPNTVCVLDIGAQNTRAIRITRDGKIKDFKVNDKCAAGSGSFIVRAAKYLEVPIESVGKISMTSQSPQLISSICAVLAESEIINHITEGKKVEDILRGIHDSLSIRASALLRRVGLTEELTFVGGVAVQEGMIAALQEKLQMKVNIPQYPQFLVAFGAALLGRKRYEKRND